MRIALGVEYDGSSYHGWQIQPHATSVQACLEEALSKVANHPVKIVCAGRTDTGVHATAQVIHFDTDSLRTTYQWLLGVNSNLSTDISVVWVCEVDDRFHARFDALERQYRYVILNRVTRSALLRQRATWECRELDVYRMIEGAQYLQGEHDFSSFRALGCQAKTPHRDIRRLDISRKGELIYIDIVANAFLHHMVRNIAGTLMMVGRGEQKPVWVEQVLEARDRTQGGITAPADGLYLVRVQYPEEYGLPQTARLPMYG